jgi:hypothetical protein
MLHSLEVENYRGLERYRVEDLARVNLLVGKNNCGKTTLLEAVQFIADHDGPAVISRTALRRGEVLVVPSESDEAPTRRYPLIVHFFHGHVLSPGRTFTIRADDGAVDWTGRLETQGPVEETRAEASGADAARSESWFRGRRREGSAANGGFRSRVTKEGAMLSDLFQVVPGMWELVRDEPQAARFLTPAGLHPRRLRQMWDWAIKHGREGDVVAALRVLAPRVNGLFFLSDEAVWRGGGQGGILVGFEGQAHRDPIGTHGDGMQRMLGLSLALVRSRGGVLLVDEIDTGLHHSVMADMWRLVTKAAVDQDIQVFATTHSRDCVQGLAWLCESHPELADHVSLQKIEPSLSQAVGIGAAEIQLAARHGIEVR